MDKEYPSTSSGNIRKDIWNKFILENNGLFLQSWEWGEFQKSFGRKIWRLQDEKFQALIIKYDLPLGKNYLYCPGGPVSKFQHLTPTLSSNEEREQNIVRDFLSEIKEIVGKEKSIFLRIEPFVKVSSPENSSPREELFSGNLPVLRFVKAAGGQNILQTLILNLNKPEEELLAEMKQKARYNIRLAEKHGIKIRISSEPEKEIESFWRLVQETSRRDKFGLHTKEHYKGLFSARHSRESGNPECLQTELFLAEHNNKIIAANIVVFFGNRAIYLHGASSNEYRNLMAPYLSQWEQIKEAKKQGFQIYDFWGIDEIKWPGVTRFKKGFGGEEIKYIGTYDYVFDKKWHWVYRLAKKF
jgi:lipid II:glycine glycyltransferase (peptidoglycan interpeptide bridge formation enzyme)